MPISRISLVMPYYDNPVMLAKHYETWAAFPDELKRRLEVVIVDDGSPGIAAAQVERPNGLPSLKIFRVTVDLAWHQHAARNIGAREAKGPFLLLTDMDLLVPEETFIELLKFDPKSESEVYTFLRIDADTMKPKLHPLTGKEHPHPNTFAMSKKFYWMVGGYDEDYCGIYGTDGLFRKKLWAVADHVPLRLPIMRYAREVVADASTTSLPRKEGREEGAKQRIDDRKRADGTFGKPKVLSMPYLCAYKHDPYRGS